MTRAGIADVAVTVVPADAKQPDAQACLVVAIGMDTHNSGFDGSCFDVYLPLSVLTCVLNTEALHC